MSDVRRRRTAAEPDNDDQGQGQAGDEQAAANHEKAELMDLPDEMLVEIFSYLPDAKQVLRLRAVCRRWRDLLLHPDVWRRREVCDDDRSYAFLDAVFSLAPCLRSVSLSRDYYLETRGVLVATTACAVRNIEFIAYGHDGFLLTVIIKNLASLGRLREVSFYPLDLDLPLSRDFRVLLRTLCEAEGLTSLMLDNDANSEILSQYDNFSGSERAALPGAVPPTTAKPSLVKFFCCGWMPDAALEYLLRCHAPTLEHVSLESLRRGSSAPVAALLSEAPKLQHLKTTLIPDMVLLKKCPHLEILALALRGTVSVDLLRDAKAFLREATHLRKVELSLQIDEEATVKDVVEGVFGALAASRCSEVRSIVLRPSYGSDVVPPLPAGVVGSLSGLPHLRRLEIERCSISPTFLAAVTPDSAPSLRWLEVRDPEECAHAWIHSAPVEGMLQKNRMLHLKFFGFLCKDESNGSACEVCRRGCHLYKAAGSRKTHAYITAFSHSNEGAPCGEEHDYYSSYCFEL